MSTSESSEEPPFRDPEEEKRKRIGARRKELKEKAEEADETGLAATLRQDIKKFGGGPRVAGEYHGPLRRGEAVRGHRRAGARLDSLG